MRVVYASSSIVSLHGVRLFIPRSCECVSACECVLRVLSRCITMLDLVAIVMQLVVAEGEGDKQVHAASAVSHACF